MPTPIQNIVFAVCDEPHSVWGWDLEERNIRFLKGLDADYFDYVISSHEAQLEGPFAQRAAIALRINYHLCLETLFSLLGATLQAPKCIVGWLLKCKTEQLRRLMSNIDEVPKNFHVGWHANIRNLDDLANLIFSQTRWDSENSNLITKEFSSLWRKLLDDFLNEDCSNEYNSIKHGFRAQSGGFLLRFGAEHEYGVPPPENEMSPWFGSRFGTSFYSAEKISGHRNSGRDPHFFLKNHSLNWLPENNIERMRLAACSIRNIRSFLLCINGVDEGEISFQRPDNNTAFSAPWDRVPGIISTNYDLTISEFHITRHSVAELKKLLI